ncbi:MAG: phage minor structural family protein [Oscillospiraceae bacterium]|nr:phage minor structural family protein [Oscillospiraceae bacterium]
MKREWITKLLPDITREALDAIMEENGKDIEAVKAKYADYDSLKAQLTEAGKTIEGFKAMDIDGIRKSADEWKTKAEKAEADAAAKIADMEFSGLLDGAISTARGKNAKVVKALLDLETLKASKNQSEDIKTALETVKTDNGYLFEDTTTPPPYAGGTGTKPIQARYTPEVNSIRAAAGLKAE